MSSDLPYTSRKLLIEQARTIKRAEAALRALKREWEKLKEIDRQLSGKEDIDESSR